MPLRAAIQTFVHELIISEEIGVAKPDPVFFEVASARSGNPPKSEILLIGDSLTSDIRGGVNYGIGTSGSTRQASQDRTGWGLRMRSDT